MRYRARRDGEVSPGPAKPWAVCDEKADGLPVTWCHDAD